MAEKAKGLRKFTRDQGNGARREVLEELFNDLYRDRRSIYLMNFFRGLFFGIGSVLGGTLIIAFAIWVLSFFVNLPGVGDTVQDVQNTLEKSRAK